MVKPYNLFVWEGRSTASLCLTLNSIRRCYFRLTCPMTSFTAPSILDWKTAPKTINTSSKTIMTLRAALQRRGWEEQQFLRPFLPVSIKLSSSLPPSESVDILKHLQVSLHNSQVQELRAQLNSCLDDLYPIEPKIRADDVDRSNIATTSRRKIKIISGYLQDSHYWWQQRREDLTSQQVLWWQLSRRSDSHCRWGLISCS